MLPLSWILTSFSFIASNGSNRAGNCSYSTWISDRASETVSSSSAATARTGSPMNLTTLSRMNICFFFFSVRRKNQYWTTFGTSSIVAMALTPGRLFTLAISMLVTLAWGCGLRRSLACSMPSIFKSVAYLARPVTLSIASIRLRLLPTTDSLSLMLRLPYGSGCLKDCLHLPVIPRAPAKIAGESFPYCILRRIWIMVKYRF